MYRRHKMAVQVKKRKKKNRKIKKIQKPKKSRQWVHNNIWGGMAPVEKKAFLMGKEMGTVEATMLYMLVNMSIKYKIWKYKLAGVMPKENSITNDVKRWLNDITWYQKWRIWLPLVRRLVYE